MQGYSNGSEMAAEYGKNIQEWLDDDYTQRYIEIKQASTVEPIIVTKEDGTVMVSDVMRIHFSRFLDPNIDMLYGELLAKKFGSVENIFEAYEKDRKAA
jgi:hypothetical protein